MKATAEVGSVLITGATGYLGQRLVRMFLELHWQVSVVLRTLGNSLPDDIASKVRSFVYDGTTASLMEAAGLAKPDIAIHLASTVLATHKPEDVGSLVSTNVLFGTQLIEACANSGARGFINTGTFWQHFDETLYKPVCLYAATKQAFEDILTFYAETSKIRVLTLTLFDIYGPGDPRPKLLNLLRQHARSGEVLRMSPGKQLIDLVHIDDVVRAYYIATERILRNDGREPRYERFKIANGEPISLRELVAQLGKTTESSLNIEWGARPYRPREVMRPWSPDPYLPQWEPSVTLDEGLKQLMSSD